MKNFCKSFKKEGKFWKHHCDFQVSTIVRIHNNIGNDLEDQESLDPDTNEVARDAQDEIVAQTEQLFPDINVDVNKANIFNTPPCRCQNRLAKYREQKVFDINKMLEKIEAKEKREI